MQQVKREAEAEPEAYGVYSSIANPTGAVPMAMVDKAIAVDTTGVDNTWSPLINLCSTFLLNYLFANLSVLVSFNA